MGEGERWGRWVRERGGGGTEVGGERGVPVHVHLAELHALAAVGAERQVLQHVVRVWRETERVERVERERDSGGRTRERESCGIARQRVEGERVSWEGGVPAAAVLSSAHT